MNTQTLCQCETISDCIGPTTAVGLLMCRRAQALPGGAFVPEGFAGKNVAASVHPWCGCHPPHCAERVGEAVSGICEFAHRPRPAPAEVHTIDHQGRARLTGWYSAEDLRRIADALDRYGLTTAAASRPEGLVTENDGEGC